MSEASALVEAALNRAVEFSFPLKSAALACWAESAESTAMLDREEVAVALASALLPREPCDSVAAINDLGLARVETTWGEGCGLTLDPQEAVGHPLLAPWIGVDLAQGLSTLVWAGGVAAMLAPSAPVPKDVELRETSGARDARSLEAGISYLFRGAEDRLVTVRAIYGQPCAEPQLTTTHRLSASVWLQLGAHLRSAPAAPAPVAEAAAPAISTPPPVTVH